MPAAGEFQHPAERSVVTNLLRLYHLPLQGNITGLGVDVITLTVFGAGDTGSPAGVQPEAVCAARNRSSPSCKKRTNSSPRRTTSSLTRAARTSPW